jgi:epsilon-lactone hydrolase
VSAVRLSGIATAALLCTGLLSRIAGAQNPPPGVKADGTVTAPALAVPYSDLASPEARAFFPRMLAAGSKAPPLGAPIAESRAFYDQLNSDRVARLEKLYPVKIHAETMAGVSTDVVLPARGVAPRNRQRVLINLHGGAFLWGEHSGGLVESIPIAAIGRIKVISVNYRQGPEYTFPAASDDVEAVYRVLLAHYQPGEIGIYGCSAGGALTAQAVARFITDHLPVPGAIGTFCSSLVDLGGDSAYIAPLLNGQGVPAVPLTLGVLPYFRGVDPGPAGAAGTVAQPAGQVPADAPHHRHPRPGDELGDPQPATARARRRTGGIARLGRHVALVLLRPGDARIGGGLSDDREFLPSSPGSSLRQYACAGERAFE